MSIPLRNLGRSFVYGNHLLSLGYCAMVCNYLIFLNHVEKVNVVTVCLVVYLISQLIYNADHLKDLFEDGAGNEERTRYLRQRKFTEIVLFILYLLALFALLLFYGNGKTWGFVLIFLVGGLIYPKSLTKNIVGFKNFYVSLFVTAIVSFPFFFYSFLPGFSFTLYVLYIFPRALINTIFFDFKDFEADRMRGLKTFPVAFGKEKTFHILRVLNIVSILPIIFGVLMHALPVYFGSLILVAVYANWFINRSIEASPNALKFISYVAVDGEYLLSFIILCFAFYLKG